MLYNLTNKAEYKFLMYQITVLLFVIIRISDRQRCAKIENKYFCCSAECIL